MRRITGELAKLAEHAGNDDQRLLVNARRALRRAQVRPAELAAVPWRDGARPARSSQRTRQIDRPPQVPEPPTTSVPGVCVG